LRKHTAEWRAMDNRVIHDKSSRSGRIEVQTGSIPVSRTTFEVHKRS
jgi:hypothetical protein